ncbi:MAG: sulfotransferase [Maricaulaceae bacterium]
MTGFVDPAPADTVELARSAPQFFCLAAPLPGEGFDLRLRGDPERARIRLGSSAGALLEIDLDRTEDRLSLEGIGANGWGRLGGGRIPHGVERLDIIAAEKRVLVRVNGQAVAGAEVNFAWSRVISVAADAAWSRIEPTRLAPRAAMAARAVRHDLDVQTGDETGREDWTVCADPTDLTPLQAELRAGRRVVGVLTHPRLARELAMACEPEIASGRVVVYNARLGPALGWGATSVEPPDGAVVRRLPLRIVTLDALNHAHGRIFAVCAPADMLATIMPESAIRPERLVFTAPCPADDPQLATLIAAGYARRGVTMADEGEAPSLVDGLARDDDTATTPSTERRRRAALTAHARADLPDPRPAAAHGGAQNRPVAILATGRSGTTVLQRYLNLSPELTIWGEHDGFLHAIASAWRRLVDPKNQNRFMEYSQDLMATVIAGEPVKAEGRWSTEWFNPLTPTHVGDAFRNLILDLFAKPLPDNVRWGFKEIQYNPETFSLLRALFPDIYVLFPIRNPFDIIASKIAAFDHGQIEAADIDGYVQHGLRFFDLIDFAKATETAHACVWLSELQTDPHRVISDLTRFLDLEPIAPEKISYIADAPRRAATEVAPIDLDDLSVRLEHTRGWSQLWSTYQTRLAGRETLQLAS